jgi:hypothetical protein
MAGETEAQSQESMCLNSYGVNSGWISVDSGSYLPAKIGSVSLLVFGCLE